MSSRQRVPQKGDILVLDCDDEEGQNRRQMAVVLTPRSYNVHGRAILCPISDTKKGYPFEIAIQECPGKVAIADQFCTVGWEKRNPCLMGAATEDELQSIRQYFMILLSEADD